MVAKCWRARISVGAISAAWPPASTARAMASSATTVLPEPTSPCSSRSMRVGPGEVGLDLGQRAVLRCGQRVGQGGPDLVGEPAVAGERPARQALRSCCAHQRQRQLAGQQLVIGEPAPGGGLRRRHRSGSARIVQPGKRLAEGGEALPPSASSASCHSGRSGRRSRACADGPAQHSWPRARRSADRPARPAAGSRPRRRARYGRDAPSRAAVEPSRPCR